jgi:hypothetical protein
MLKRLIVATIATTGLTIAAGSAAGLALETCDPSGSAGDGRIGAGVGPCPSPTPQPGPDPAPPGPVCTAWQPIESDPVVPDRYKRIAADGALETLSYRDCEPGGRYARWISSPTPKSVANQAFGDLQSKGLPKPTAKTGPPLNKMIVNFETWIAVEPEDPVTVTADAGGITSTVTATPVRIEFRTGTISTKDVAVVECLPWGSIDYGACTWTPRFPSVELATGTTDLTYHGSISIIWDITWTSNTGPAGSLGQLTTTTPLNITVMEIQTIGGAGLPMPATTEPAGLP